MTKVANAQPNNKSFGVVVWLRHTQADVVVVCNYCTSQTMLGASVCQMYCTCDFFINISAEYQKAWDGKQSSSVHGCRWLLKQVGLKERHSPLPTYLYIFQNTRKPCSPLGTPTPCPT